jgi:hypothetical protein
VKLLAPFMNEQQKSSLPLGRIDKMINCSEEEMMESNLQTIHASKPRTNQAIPKKRERNLKDLISVCHTVAASAKNQETKTKKPKYK